jgi:hypothetical protein
MVAVVRQRFEVRHEHEKNSGAMLRGFAAYEILVVYSALNLFLHLSSYSHTT